VFRVDCQYSETILPKDDPKSASEFLQNGDLSNFESRLGSHGCELAQKLTSQAFRDYFRVVRQEGPDGGIWEREPCPRLSARGIIRVTDGSTPGHESG
jgi:hypothetical protein